MNYSRLEILFIIIINTVWVVSVLMDKVGDGQKKSVIVQKIPLETFDWTVNLSSRSGLLVSPKTPVYLLKSKSLNSIIEKNAKSTLDNDEVEAKKRNRRYVKEKIIPVPDIIYPEILIIIDYYLYKNYDRRSIIPYLLSFWNKVDSIFYPLKNPRFKLSIAGIVVAQDDAVFDFFIPSESLEIDYGNVRRKMNLWLSKARKAIPFESYDTFIIMTRTRDRKNSGMQVLGISDIETACSTPELNHKAGGIILAPGGLQGTRTAGHEIGHIFGAKHDEAVCGKSYLMAPFDGKFIRWSQCSINKFHEVLKRKNWTCLYNTPDHSKSKNFEIHEVFESPEAEVRDKSYFSMLMNGEKESLSLSEFTFSKEIVIYYADEMLIIEQDRLVPPVKLREKELKYRIPDYRKLRLNPREINPFKKINIYHENNSIYVYQGSKPVNITHNQAPQVLDVTFTDDYQLKFTEDDFDPEKLVLIYYRDSKLHVTQKNVPENKYLYDKRNWDNLKYIGSDRTTIFVYPITFITSSEITVKHRDDLIYIYQFQEPDLSGREYEPYTVRYLPDLVNLEPEVHKRGNFNADFETKFTYSVNTNEFNPNKLVVVEFKNGRVKVKQIGMFMEEKKGVSRDYKNLQIITADVNTVLLHPRKIPRRNEIKIRHDSGKIFIWQGTGQLPDKNVDRPDVVEILEPDNFYLDYLDYF